MATTGERTSRRGNLEGIRHGDVRQVAQSSFDLMADLSKVAGENGNEEVNEQDDRYKNVSNVKQEEDGDVNALRSTQDHVSHGKRDIGHAIEPCG